MGNNRKHENAGYGNPLIISYSYSGNTHRIAQEIQSVLQCDWCEIYPWQPYPMAFTELLEQVRKEIRTKYRPSLLPVSCSPQPYRVIPVSYTHLDVYKRQPSFRWWKAAKGLWM